MCPHEKIKGEGFLELWKKFYSWFSRLSLFIKVGFVMGLCEVLIVIIFINLYLQLNKIESIAFRQCSEYLTAAFYLKSSLLNSKKEIEKKVALREAQKLLDLMVNGGSVTVKNGDLKFSFNFKPEQLCISVEVLKQILGEIKKANVSPQNYQKVLKELDKLIYQLLYNNFENRKEIKRLIKLIRYSQFILLVLLGVILICGGIAFFTMVLIPLKRATTKIHEIAYTEHIEDVASRTLSVPFKDEIGKLVSEVNELIKYFAELSRFKRILEEDTSLDDVFSRLAQLLKDKFKLKQFIIYIVSNSDNTMKVVHKEPEDLPINQEILVMADLCRAKRTGRVISSLETKGICKMFIHPDAHHICIPLICSGKVEGVIQIIFSEEERQLIEKVKQAMPQLNAFLEQTLPVLEAKRYAESLKELTIKDPLTGLYNRRFVEQVLDNITAGILRRSTVLGVLMCDVDYFKKVNDQYGHDVGDEILKEIARVLRENVRKSDIVSRFGGEEFLILLVDVRKGDAEMVAEKLRKKVESVTFHTKAGPLKKTISIGVSEFPVDSTGIWQVIKFADVALYKAKELGRNRVVRFKPDMWENPEEYLKKK